LNCVDVSKISVMRPYGGGHKVEGLRDASGLYEVERRAYHAARPGFRIAELQISLT